MITDIEFQNRRDVMRLAPWLDMPLLRTRLRDVLRAQLEDNHHGFLGGYVKAYRDDMKSFCDGERDRIPRCSSAVEFLQTKIPDIFPAAADRLRFEATNLICTHIMQIGMWRNHERGAEPQETPGETPHRTNPLLEEGPQDYDEEYNEEYDDEEEY